MNVEQLLNHSRLRLTKMGLGGLIDAVLLDYLNTAYTSYVGLMKGVSDEEDVTVVAGATEITLPDYVLKIKSAQLSDGTFVDVINRSDTRVSEFNKEFGKAGEVRKVLVGTKGRVCKVAYSPETDTVITFDVDRLPATDLVDTTDIPDDLLPNKHVDLIDSVIAQVLGSHPDPSVRQQKDEFEGRFAANASISRKEKERFKSKVVREVVYGGL